MKKGLFMALFITLSMDFPSLNRARARRMTFMNSSGRASLNRKPVACLQSFECERIVSARPPVFLAMGMDPYLMACC